MTEIDYTASPHQDTTGDAKELKSNEFPMNQSHNLIDDESNFSETREVKVEDEETSGLPQKDGFYVWTKEKFTTIFDRKKIQTFIAVNFLVIGVLVSIIFALSYPVPGAYLSKIVVGENIRLVSFINICIVFLISGLTLKVNEAALIYEHSVAILYGVATINFLTTFLAFAIRVLPFETSEFALGLTIFATVPTTLGVGISLTLAAKGDQVLATFLTVISNMLGIATVPALLNVYLQGENSNVNIDPLGLSLQLIYNLLIPTLVGIVCQVYIPGVKPLVTKYKVELSMFSSFNLFVIVFMALSASQPILIQQNPVEIILVCIAAIIMHLIYLAANYIICFKVLKFQFPQAVAVTILSSQKSSPVALAIIAGITTNVQKTGLLATPCIIGQLAQILIGTFVAKYFVQLYDSLLVLPEVDPTP